MSANYIMPINIIHKITAFFVRDFKIAVSYKLNFFLQGLGIFFTTSTLFLASRMLVDEKLPLLEPYGGDFFSFVIIGIAFSDFLVISSNTFAREIRSAQMVGTLEALLVTPTSITTILLSSYFYKLLSTSLRVFFYLLIGAFIYGIQLNVESLPTIFITFILTLLPFFGLGLLSASFIIVFKQGSPISMFMAMSSGLLGGVLYPVAVLPSWLKPFSSILPITHGLEAMRQVLLQGATIGEISTRLYYLAIFAIILLAAGIYSIYVALKVAKREGSLLHY